MTKTDTLLNVRHNSVAFLVDYVSFGLAMNFSSLTTVLPAFVGLLTASQPLIGLIGTIFTGGWLIPQSFVAPLVEARPFKKPTLVISSLIGRPFFLLLAVAVALGLTRYPVAMLAVLYLSMLVFNVCDGVASIAWFDMLARAIPLARRSRLLALAQVFTGLLGVGVAALVRLILGQQGPAWPYNFALLFGLAGAALLVSLVALMAIREAAPDLGGSADQATAMPKRAAPPRFWVHLWQVLRDDATFRILMLVRMLVGTVQLALTFYVVHARNALLLPDHALGNFVIAEVVGRVVASLGLGMLSERLGPRAVIRAGAIAALLGTLYALLAEVLRLPWLSNGYPVVFFTLGVVNSSYMLGFFNYLMEIAPRDRCPTYIGLSNTLTGIVVLFPMLGGFLLEATSYRVLFGLTAITLGAGLLMSLRLRPSGEAPAA